MKGKDILEEAVGSADKERFKNSMLYIQEQINTCDSKIERLNELKSQYQEILEKTGNMDLKAWVKENPSTATVEKEKTKSTKK